MAQSKELYLSRTLLVIIIIMGVIIFYEVLPYLSGVLGACTVYLLVRKQMKRLTEKRKIKPMYAALFILLETLLCFLIPAFLVIWLLVNKINSLDVNMHTIVDTVHQQINNFNNYTGYDLLASVNLTKVAGYATDIAQIVVGQLSAFIINSLVMLFILYFMLLGRTQMESYLYSLMPFKEKYKKQVLGEIDKMVRANAIGIPLLAIIQGFFAGFGYFLFGAPDPILFGFVTCFATIIPLLGTALVWFPLSLYLGISGNWPMGIGLTVYALVVISNIDNLARFILQEKMASTHPLITVFGVIIGLTLFGFWGVIFGPLLLSMFFLCFDIYKKEFIDNLK